MTCLDHGESGIGHREGTTREGGRAMAFTTPDFNVTFDGWTAGHTPAVDPPDTVGNPCQLYVNSRIPVDQTPGNPDLWVPIIFLRIPLLGYRPVRGDILEVRPPSADYYKARWVQNCHVGFPNEYVIAVVEQCNSAGTTPRP
jgi:hypothetical protein